MCITCRLNISLKNAGTCILSNSEEVKILSGFSTDKRQFGTVWLTEQLQKYRVNGTQLEDHLFGNL
jgi:hypothetical protein